MLQTFSYKIIQDIDKDAWNWWHACNRKSHGVNWKDRVPAEISEKIIGKTFDEAKDFLLPFLTEKYQAEKIVIDDYFKKTEKYFLENFSPACSRMSQVTGQPLYRQDFILVLTTFPRAPYNCEQGMVWLPIGWSEPLRLFLHELCHFQFIYYWRNNSESEVSQLSESAFDYLKESLTIILDPGDFPMINSADKGYEIHQDFRDLLKDSWHKDKNFAKLIKLGCQKIQDFI